MSNIKFKGFNIYPCPSWTVFPDDLSIFVACYNPTVTLCAAGNGFLTSWWIGRALTTYICLLPGIPVHVSNLHNCSRHDNMKPSLSLSTGLTPCLSPHLCCVLNFQVQFLPNSNGNVMPFLLLKVNAFVTFTFLLLNVMPLLLLKQ